MADGPPHSAAANPRNIPLRMADRLIAALDVPTIGAARALAEKLDGTVSLFKIGLWLAFAEGIDSFMRELLQRGKTIFLDAKMHDIGKTVEEGVARAADRGVGLLTVHAEPQVMQSAVRGKRGSATKIFAVTVLTSLGDDDLRNMGYRLSAQDLVRLRVRQAADLGCDGVIASAHDDPDAIRLVAGSDRLLIATPGVRSAGEMLDDHKRFATPEQAIRRGADYLVVGRQIIAKPDPAGEARKVIEEMERGARLRQAAV